MKLSDNLGFAAFTVMREQKNHLPLFLAWILTSGFPLAQSDFRGSSKDHFHFWCEIWRVIFVGCPLCQANSNTEHYFNAYTQGVLLGSLTIDNSNGSCWFSGHCSANGVNKMEHWKDRPTSLLILPFIYQSLLGNRKKVSVQFQLWSGK